MNKVADSSGSKYSQIMSKFETSPQAKRAPIVSPSVVPPPRSLDPFSIDSRLIPQSAAFGRSTSGFKAAPVKAQKVDEDGWGEDAPPITANAPSFVVSPS